jgi:hypothetical protein
LVDVIQGLSAPKPKFSELFQDQNIFAHLYCPPPISCVHLAPNAVRLLVVSIMPFGSNDQVLSKFGVAVDRPNAQ